MPKSTLLFRQNPLHSFIDAYRLKKKTIGKRKRGDEVSDYGTERLLDKLQKLHRKDLTTPTGGGGPREPGGGRGSIALAAFKCFRALQLWKTPLFACNLTLGPNVQLHCLCAASDVVEKKEETEKKAAVYMLYSKKKNVKGDKRFLPLMRACVEMDKQYGFKTYDSAYLLRIRPEGVYRYPLPSTLIEKDL